MDNIWKTMVDNTGQLNMATSRITAVRVAVYVPGGVSLPDRVRVSLKEQDKLFCPFRRKLATVSLHKATWTPVTHDVLRAESRKTVDISVDELLRLSQRKRLSLQLSCRKSRLVLYKSLAGFSLLFNQTKDEELFIQIHYPGCCPQAVQEDERANDNFLSVTSQIEDTDKTQTTHITETINVTETTDITETIITETTNVTETTDITETIITETTNVTETTHSTLCQDNSEETTDKQCQEQTVNDPFFFPLPRLAEEDRKDILQKRWLSDDVMDLAQEIVRRVRPETRGLYACAGAFTLDPLDPTDDTLFLQIINASTPSSLASMNDYLSTGGTHWLLVSNFGAERGSLCLYDSLRTSASPSTAELTRHLLSRCTKPQISFPGVQQQKDSYSCGMYAVAFAFSIAVGEDPASRHYLHDRMASHLLECLEQGCLRPFPSRSVGGHQHKTRGNKKKRANKHLNF